MKLMRFFCMAFSIVGLSILTAQEQAQLGEQSKVQSDNWHIGLGVSYRNFRNPKFQSTNIPNFTGVFSAASPSIIEYTPANIATFGANGLEIVNIVHYTGGSVRSSGDYGFGESLAPVVNFSMGLVQQDNLELNLVANLQYFSMDSASRRTGFAGGDEYTRLMNVMYGVPAGVEYDEIVGETKKTNYLGGLGRSKFTMDLYVLDLGLSLNYIFENGLQAFVAAGPSISLADMESSSSAAINGGLTRSSGRDNDIDYIFGMYASAGASYWITEKVGLSLEVRYDEGFNDADTRFVSQDLDGFGGMLKCLFRF
jgi:opacity protein-like surface antigen